VSDGPDRSQLARDLIVFQLKLLAGGARDVVLSPVALIAALLGLISGRVASRQLFYDVVRIGRRTEDWIDPFGIVEDGAHEEGSLGDILTRLERQVREEYKRRGPGDAAPPPAADPPATGEDQQPKE
jgi:hypothetical protein